MLILTWAFTTVAVTQTKADFDLSDIGFSEVMRISGSQGILSERGVVPGPGTGPGFAFEDLILPYQTFRVYRDGRIEQQEDGRVTLRLYDEESFPGGGFSGTRAEAMASLSGLRNWAADFEYLAWEIRPFTNPVTGNVSYPSFGELLENLAETDPSAVHDAPGGGFSAIYKVAVRDFVRTASWSGNGAFGSLVVGESVTRSFEVENTSDALLVIQGMELPEGFQGALQAILEPDESVAFDITFRPEDPGTYGGTVELISNATEHISRIALSGVGVVLELDSQGTTATTLGPIRRLTDSFVIRNPSDYPVSGIVINSPEDWLGLRLVTGSSIFQPQLEIDLDSKGESRIRWQADFTDLDLGIFEALLLPTGESNLEYSLRLMNADAFLPRVVENSTGAAISGAVLHVTGPENFEVELETGDDGFPYPNFMVTRSGNYQITAFAEGYLESGPRGAVSTAGQSQYPVFELEVLPVERPNLWEDAEEFDGGWLASSWFGWFLEFDDWLYHSEHGWLFVAAENTDSMFLFDLAIGEWAWTGDWLYPWMFWFGDIGGWSWYHEGGEPGERWFYFPERDVALIETDL